MTHRLTRLVACVMFVAYAPAARDARADDARANDREMRQTIEQACWMCHSKEMMSQQRLVRAQWDKTVTKMEKWGPPLQEDEAAQLAAFLAGPASPAASPAPQAMMTVAELQARLAPEAGAERGNAANGAPLFVKDCAPCHGNDARGHLAPSLIGRPVLSRPAEWTAVIRKGRRRMPAYDDRLSAAEILDILAWVRRTSRETVEARASK